MKKIYNDIVKSVIGTDDFSLADFNSQYRYPIDLDFTLNDLAFYYTPVDDKGIPYRVYQSVGKQYNPTRIAAFALANHNRYVETGLEDFQVCFLKCADWFLQDEMGRYEYHFDWGELKAPWISCMAQGEAASVLVRAFRLTSDEKYLKQAVKALEPLFVPISEGGVQSTLPDGSIFIEEYPLDKPTNVLNGFLYALIGLADYADATNSDRHKKLFDHLSKSVCKNILTWSCGNWSLYEDQTKSKGINFCTPSYHNLQVSQLKWLHSRVASPGLAMVIESWDKGLNSLVTRLTALLGKIVFRLKNKAQR